MLPKLRKSLQKNENRRISPPALAQKTPQAIEPPKAVIKALYDYSQASPAELSFTKGDFFHVIGNETDDSWYAIVRPALITGTKLVILQVEREDWCRSHTFKSSEGMSKIASI